MRADKSQIRIKRLRRVRPNTAPSTTPPRPARGPPSSAPRRPRPRSPSCARATRARGSSCTRRAATRSTRATRAPSRRRSRGTSPRRAPAPWIFFVVSHDAGPRRPRRAPPRHGGQAGRERRLGRQLDGRLPLRRPRDRLRAAVGACGVVERHQMDARTGGVLRKGFRLLRRNVTT